MQPHIDDQFREALSDLGGNPPGVNRDPEQNWAQIRAMLDQDRRRPVPLWRWIAAAASVALIVGVSWSILSKQMATKETKLPQQENLAEAVPLVSNADTLAAPPAPPASDQQMARVQPEQNQQAVILYSHKDELINVTIADQLSSSSAYTYNWSADAHLAMPIPATGGTYLVAVDMLGKKGGKGKRKKADEKPEMIDGTFASGRFKNKLSLGKDIDGESQDPNHDPYTGETYAQLEENRFLSPANAPLSTFSIDVDRASYANHRRFVQDGSLPPKYSVRVEEFINNFHYEYAQPQGEHPVAIHMEVSDCPWDKRHRLVAIGLQGKEVKTEKVPASNLVFLLDVSGSMESEDKLPLLKRSMTRLVEQLREDDRVAIVVYAGAAGVVLPATSGADKRTIIDALDRLTAGGSTAGGEGIELAYKIAKENFRPNGNNRVILATDGDFNVGINDNTALENLITQKREDGIFLTVLGLGTGNIQDSRMEMLADKGNGNYNYIDSENEGKKVLVEEFSGTLFTIAKDVKLQIEFNPAQVKGYRLIGYENRKLRDEDFANDKIDAGDMGAGHTVTALYEIIPAGSSEDCCGPNLKYQQPKSTKTDAGDELLTLSLRYKKPDGFRSVLLSKALKDNGGNLLSSSDNFRWAAAVASYGMILRESEFKGDASYDKVLALARSAASHDPGGYRAEFIELVTKAATLSLSAQDK